MVLTNNILAGLLYMSSCATTDNMINYIERPEYGTNLFTFNTEPEVREGDFEGKEGRTLSNKSNVSYFDKMKKLE